MIGLAECLILLVVFGGGVAAVVALVIAAGKKKGVAPGRSGLVIPPPPAPPAPPAPLKVMRMLTHGLVRVVEGGVEHEETLPDSPLGHGEFPTAITGAPGGEVYVVGKLYTGRPGPDDGVVYRRQGGGWEIVHRLPERTFHSVCVHSGNVCAGAVGGYAVAEGGHWGFVPLPYESVVNLWVEDGRLKGAAWDGSLAWDLSGPQPVAAPPRRAPEGNARQCQLGEARFTVFDRSTELGEATLSAAESAQIRAELELVKRELERRGK